MELKILGGAVTAWSERLLLGFAALVLAVGATLLGYAVGHYRGSGEGRALASLEHKAQALDAVQAMLLQNAQLITTAQEVSSKLRTAAAMRQETNTNTNKELSDALNKTAADRAGCRLDAASMQQLAAAQSRAATAATPARASRSAGSMPTATSTTQR